MINFRYQQEKTSYPNWSRATPPQAKFVS